MLLLGRERSGEGEGRGPEGCCIFSSLFHISRFNRTQSVLSLYFQKNPHFIIIIIIIIFSKALPQYLILLLCAYMQERKSNFLDTVHKRGLDTFAGFSATLLHCVLNSLRKHAYSNVLKISSPKTESFQIKILIFFIFLLKTDCGYSLEPPRRGGSNEYPQSMFLTDIRKIMYTPVNPSFTV